MFFPSKEAKVSTRFRPTPYTFNTRTVSAHEREHAHVREHLQALHCTWPFYKLVATIRSCGVVGGLGDLFGSYYPSRRNFRDSDGRKTF
jgi:hypothetical protein